MHSALHRARACATVDPQYGSLVGGGVASGAAAIAELELRDDAEQEQVGGGHA
jgi:hypothetical protein